MKKCFALQNKFQREVFVQYWWQLSWKVVLVLCQHYSRASAQATHRFILPTLSPSWAHLIPTQADVKEVEELGPSGSEARSTHQRTHLAEVAKIVIQALVILDIGHQAVTEAGRVVLQGRGIH